MAAFYLLVPTLLRLLSLWREIPKGVFSLNGNACVSPWLPKAAPKAVLIKSPVFFPPLRVDKDLGNWSLSIFQTLLFPHKQIPDFSFLILGVFPTADFFLPP